MSTHVVLYELDGNVVFDNPGDYDADQIVSYLATQDPPITGYKVERSSLPDDFFQEAWSLDSNGTLTVDFAAAKEIARGYAKRHAWDALERYRIRSGLGEPSTNTIVADFEAMEASFSAATTIDEIVTAMDTFHDTFGMDWRTGIWDAGSPGV